MIIFKGFMKSSKEKNAERHKAAYETLSKRITSLEKLEVVLDQRIVTAEAGVAQSRLDAIRCVKTDYAKFMTRKYMLMKRRVISLRQNYMNIFQTRMQLLQRFDLMPVIIATIESVEDLKAITPPDSVTKLDKAIESAELLNETTKELEYQIQQFAQITAVGNGIDEFSNDDIDRELAELDADNKSEQLLQAMPVPTTSLATPGRSPSSPPNNGDSTTNENTYSKTNTNNNNKPNNGSSGETLQHRLPSPPNHTTTTTATTTHSRSIENEGDLLASYEH